MTAHPILTSLHGRLSGLDKSGVPVAKAKIDGFTITPAAGASNVGTVTIQANDPEGNALAVSSVVLCWLSDAATGIGISTHAGTSAATASTGAIMGIETTGLAWLVQLDATGKAVLSLTDTGKNGTYFTIQGPNRDEPQVAASVCVYG